MIFTLHLRLWFERMLRARRYALADKPCHPTPAWIREAASFSLLESNPVSSIAAGKVKWVERAGQASRLLGTYALELQHAADSLEASRSRLALAKLSGSIPNGPPSLRQERLALSEASEFGVIERQRRALSTEREALCLLTGNLRRRYGSYQSGEAIDEIDAPQPLLSGRTLLAYFVSIRRVDVVELLLEAGSRPDAHCSDDATALSIAACKADAISRSCPAANQAAVILFLLESSSLHASLGPGHSTGTRRL